MDEQFRLTLKNNNNTEISVNGSKIGNGNFAVIAGPCAVESKEQIYAVAKAVKNSGATFLRGGAFKPRTSPYSFMGLGEEGIKLLHSAGKEYGLPIVSELPSSEYIKLFDKYVDVIQIGARNMQNYQLLKDAAMLKKTVLLKRGFCATIDEFLQAAEYVMQGTDKVILCERGIRTFENSTRYTLDVSAIAVLKSRTHLPVIADPSHSTGDSRFVASAALAITAAGADGVMIEVHDNPECALCDGKQSISVKDFDKLNKKINDVREVIK